MHSQHSSSLRNPLRRVAALLALLAASTAGAQVLISSAGSGVYTQTFDSLAASGTAAWIDNVTLPGWYASGFTGSTYTADNGTLTRRGLYSYGATGSGDRALGTLNTIASGGGQPLLFGVQLVNATGSTITGLTVSIDGELHRANNNGQNDTLTAWYGFNVSGLAATSGWTSASSLDVRGNATGLTLSLTNLSWAAGEALWMRWLDSDANNNERALAIDNFLVGAVSLSSVPEPSTYALLLGAGALAFAGIRRRRSRTARA